MSPQANQQRFCQFCGAKGATRYKGMQSQWFCGDSCKSMYDNRMFLLTRHHMSGGSIIGMGSGIAPSYASLDAAVTVYCGFCGRENQLHVVGKGFDTHKCAGCRRDLFHQ